MISVEEMGRKHMAYVIPMFDDESKFIGWRPQVASMTGYVIHKEYEDALEATIEMINSHDDRAISNETTAAMKVIKEALNNDPSYAYGWHCNIAMSFYDSIDPNEMAHKDALEVGNEAASRFMKMCFDVETSNDMLLKDKIK